ncbi:MAG: 1-acyl-sn-glycerol-3-phosphate acyltransferase [Gammaproteobacteria bacterium]|nr:1-acyl-sn-glycerol-3-phosphate acyltransferase [Gammaproteobacteria bacterium]
MGYLFILIILLIIVFLLFRFISACKKANQTDWGSPVLNVLEGMNRLFCHRYHRLNKVTIPLNDSGPAIVVSNHISGLDPMLMIAATPRPLRFLIAREQYERFGFKWLFKAVGCIPIDRSKQADNAMRLAIKALEAGEVLAIFPHGKIHLPGDSPVKLKPGAARLSNKVKCSIYPLHISGVEKQGHVLLPVVFRGNARIQLQDPIKASDYSLEEVNQMISSRIA